MNNKLTVAAVVLAHMCLILVLTTFGGCKSSSGMEKPADRSALRGSAVNSGFGGPGEVGGGFEASASTTRVSQEAPAPAPVATHPASPVTEPAPAPGAVVEPVAPAPVAEEPAVVATTKPAPVSEEPKAAGAGRTHIVRENESLWIIAKREGISIDDLTAANNIRKNAVLKKGQKLTIPAGARKVSYGSSAPKAESSAAASGDTYVVKSGDVLGTIARKHGVTIASLRSANHLKGDNIYLGQKLVIPSGGKKTAAGASGSSDKAAPAPVADKAPVSGAKPAPAPVLPDLEPFGAPPAPAPAPAPEAAPAPVTAEPAPTPIQ